MRMTASWLDPLGSTEYKDVARDLCATLGRLASDRLLLAAGGTPLVGRSRRARALPPCSGPSRNGLETICVVNDLADGHP